jgi:hypothetical protein
MENSESRKEQKDAAVRFASEMMKIYSIDRSSYMQLQLNILFVAVKEAPYRYSSPHISPYLFLASIAVSKPHLPGTCFRLESKRN